MSPQYSSSAALLFTEQELGGPCVENESYPVAQTTPSVCVMGNGDRVGLTIINLGSNQVNIGILGLVSSASGILLLPGGGSVSMTVRDDFTLPTRGWNMVSQGGTSQLYVLEIIRFTTTPTA